MIHIVTLPKRAQWIVSWSLEYYSTSTAYYGDNIEMASKQRAHVLHQWFSQWRFDETRAYKLPQRDIQLIISSLAKYSTHLYLRFTQHAQSVAVDAEWASMQFEKRVEQIEQQLLDECRNQSLLHNIEEVEAVLEYMIQISGMNEYINERSTR